MKVEYTGGCLSRHPLSEPYLVMKSWSTWKTTIVTTSKTRMLEQLALRTPWTIHVTNEHDLNPRSCTGDDTSLGMESRTDQLYGKDPVPQ